MITLRSLALWALLGVLPAVGCGEDGAAPATDGTCQSSSQCSAGQTCRLPEGICAKEPENSFAGKFQCNLVPAGTPPEQAGLGVSEVSGNLDGSVYPLLSGATCELRQVTTSSGKTYRYLDFTFFGFLTGVSRNATLDIDMDADTTQAAGRYDIYQADSVAMNSGATVLAYDVNTQSNTSIAHSSHGYLLLDQAPTVGKPLSGYVAVKMHLASGAPRVGNLCPRGVADCGRMNSSSGAVICFPLSLGGQKHRLCTRDCESDADCAPYGGACLTSAGGCFIQCSADAGCPEGTTCSAVSEDPNVPRYCLPLRSRSMSNPSRPSVRLSTLVLLALVACTDGTSGPGGGGGPIVNDDFLGGGSKLPPDTSKPSTGDCGGVTAVGECADNVVRFCENKKLYQLDCSSGGPDCSCGLNSNQVYDCVGSCGSSGAAGSGGQAGAGQGGASQGGAGGKSGAAGKAGSTGATCGGIGYSDKACNTCYQGSCCELGSACGASPPCQALIDCFGTCTSGDGGCVDSCRQKNLDGLDELSAIEACTFKSCATACGYGGCGFSSSDAPCDACLQSSCCSQGKACATNASCQALSSCLFSCSDAACEAKCEAKFPGGMALWDKFLTCLNGPCAATCGGGSGGGGTGGSGTGGSAGSGAGGSAGSGAGGGGGAGGSSVITPVCYNCALSKCQSIASACAGDPVCTSCAQKDPLQEQCKVNEIFQSLIGCACSEATCGASECASGCAVLAGG